MQRNDFNPTARSPRLRLRHTFGTRIAAVGVPMRTLMEWMGHADIKTTLIYADMRRQQRERAWVEAAFARHNASDESATRSPA